MRYLGIKDGSTIAAFECDDIDIFLTGNAEWCAQFDQIIASALEPGAPGLGHEFDEEERIFTMSEQQKAEEGIAADKVVQVGDVIAEEDILVNTIT